MSGAASSCFAGVWKILCTSSTKRVPSLTVTNGRPQTGCPTGGLSIGAALAMPGDQYLTRISEPLMTNDATGGGAALTGSDGGSAPSESSIDLSRSTTRAVRVRVR